MPVDVKRGFLRKVVVGTGPMSFCAFGCPSWTKRPTKCLQRTDITHFDRLRSLCDELMQMLTGINAAINMLFLPRIRIE